MFAAKNKLSKLHSQLAASGKLKCKKDKKAELKKACGECEKVRLCLLCLLVLLLMLLLLMMSIVFC